MSILVVVTTVMIAFFVRSLGTVSVAKQRQQAVALAGRSMEQLRALPYATVTAGLQASDLSGDANVVVVSGVSRLRLPSNGIDEPLVVSTTTPSVAPLNPHTATQTVDGVSYVTSTYVTRTSASAPYTLTTLVRWGTGSGSRTIVQRSTTFSPSGCLSAVTHPLSGPCQSSTTAQAGLTAGTISVSNDVDSTQPVVGFGGTSAELDLPLLSTSLALEQTGTAAGQVATTAAVATTTGGSRSTTGGRTAVASTSTDPSDGLPTTGSASTPAQSGSSVALSGAAGTLTAKASTADSGSAAAAAAGATTCTDRTGSALPATECASGDVRPTGADATLVLDPSGTAAVRSIGSFDLARLSAAPSSSRAVAARITTSGSAGCPTTSGDGCAYAATSRALGTLALGGLPAASAGDIRPAGYASAVTVTGLAETARAEAGTGERAPSYSRTAGTLSYWNGTAMTDVNLTSVAVPSTFDPPAVTATYRGASGDVTVTADALVTIGSATTASTGTLPCDTAQCTRSATGSAIGVTIVYSVAAAGATVTRFALTVNLGTVTAKAGYQGAPVA